MGPDRVLLGPETGVYGAGQADSYWQHCLHPLEFENEDMMFVSRRHTHYVTDLTMTKKFEKIAETRFLFLLLTHKSSMICVSTDKHAAEKCTDDCAYVCPPP